MVVARSRELFSVGHEAVGSDDALLVNSIHWFVTRKAWHLHLIVLDHVLLDNCVSSTKSCCLVDSLSVEIGFGDESIVAGDMRGSLGGSHGQLMVLITLSISICWQFVAWVVSIGAD